MGWVSIILAVIQYGPAIFNIVVEIIELIKRLRADGRKDEAAFAKASLTNAVLQYKKTKDRRLLRGLRDSLQRKCFGDDCPTGPKAA